MKVKELFELCKEAIEIGNGDKEIILCVNGNEFHPLESHFSAPIYNSNKIYEVLEEWDTDKDNVIVLN